MAKKRPASKESVEQLDERLAHLEARVDDLEQKNQPLITEEPKTPDKGYLTWTQKLLRSQSQPKKPQQPK